MSVSAPTLIGSYASGSSVGDSGNVTFSGSAAVGTLVVVQVVAGSNTATPITVTDSAGNTYTGTTARTCAGTASTIQQFYTVVTNAITGGATTFFVDRAGTGSILAKALRFTGVDTASPIGGTVTTGFSDTATTNVAITSGALSVVDGALTLFCAAYGGAGTVSARNPSGFANAWTDASTGAGNPRNGTSSYREETSTTTVTPSVTITTGNAYAATALVINAASEVNAPPVASAGADQIVREGATVTLNGSASTDGDGTIVSYLWEQLTGDPVTLSGATTSTATFTAPDDTSLTFRLTVTDDGDLEDTDDVAITVRIGSTVAVIGDSLTNMNGDGQADVIAALVAKGYDAGSIYFHGVGGKRILDADSGGDTTIENIQEAKAALVSVDRWLIALGTNDVALSTSAMAAAVDDIFDEIDGEGDVIWVGLGFYGRRNTNAITYNPVISEAVRTRGGRFADWNTHIHNGRNETGLWVYPTDSTHMTSTGYDIRVAFYADLIADDYPYSALYAIVGAGPVPAGLRVGNGSGSDVASIVVIKDGEGGGGGMGLFASENLYPSETLYPSEG